MEEIWQEIPNFEGLYEASNLGRIRSVDGKVTSSARFKKRIWKQRIMKQKMRKCKNGRLDAMVSLWKENVPYYLLVSRLVASAFIEDNLFTELTVNHKDGNPLNNNVDNLEWLTREDNIKYGFSNGQYSSIQKPINLSKDGELIRFDSYSEANAFLNRSCSYLQTIVNKKGKIATSKDGIEYQIILN